jgi:endo-1,4-beta-xylanase
LLKVIEGKSVRVKKNTPVFFQQKNCSHRTAAGLVFACLIGFLTSDSFAQPLAQGLDKFLGCSTGFELSRYLDDYWNQVTPGDAGKWASVESAQGKPIWTLLDNIYDFAIRKSILYKHHCLVWGQQQPGWVNSLDADGQRAAVENWIRMVGERYPQMSFVDVVNEPFHAPPPYKAALGGDGPTGWKWVITSFELARQYCPDSVKLILNEYNILHSDTETTNYINIITLLKDRGLIDGIGIQGHYFEFRSHTDATTGIYVYNINTIKANLDRLAALGLPIYITEFDIDEQVDANQLAQYKIYFPIFWRHPAVKGITFWGYLQDDVWSSHPYTYLLLSNGTERPALKWLKTFILTSPPPVLVSPNGTSAEPRDATLLWHPSNGATSYHIQIASSSTFSTAVVDTTAGDTLIHVNPLSANKKYYWRVSTVNGHGESEFSATANFTTGDQLSFVKENEAIPTAFKLLQNYPNPFNQTTRINYAVPRSDFVSLKVYNLIGQEAATLFEGMRQAGNYSVTFDGGELSGGVYFYQLKTQDFSETRRLILLK